MCASRLLCPMDDILELRSPGLPGLRQVSPLAVQGQPTPPKGPLLGPSVPQESGSRRCARLPGCQPQGGRWPHGFPAMRGGGQVAAAAGHLRSKTSKKGNPTEAHRSRLEFVLVECRGPAAGSPGDLSFGAAFTIGDFGPMQWFTLETRNQWRLHLSCLLYSTLTLDRTWT